MMTAAIIEEWKDHDRTLLVVVKQRDNEKRAFWGRDRNEIHVLRWLMISISR